MSRPYMAIIFCVLVFLASCSRKNISTKSDVPAEDFAVENIDFDYFTTSSKIKFDDGTKSFGATANIRIKKDSVIWISITPGFGIEVARALITQDSVMYMNRLDKEYEQYSFRELSQRLNFDMSFGLLQAVLLGNIPLEINPNDKIAKKGNFFVVTQENNNLFIENFIGAQSRKLERVAILEQGKKSRISKQNALHLSYTDFQQVDGTRQVPFKSDVSLNYQQAGQKKRTEVNIQHKKANFGDEALRFPFAIPDKYVRR